MRQENNIRYALGVSHYLALKSVNVDLDLPIEAMQLGIHDVLSIATTFGPQKLRL